MSAEILRRASALVRADCPIPVQSRGYDFIDFPTGFAIQAAGVEHADECSAAQTGGALLCDCEAIYPAWRRWRTLLAMADWLDATAERIDAGRDPKHGGRRNHSWRGSREALAAARAYLGGPDA